MKVLTVIKNLDKGGTQRAAQNFALGYKEIGHDSRFLSLYGLGYRYEEIKDVIPVFDSLTENTLKALTEWQPDIIHIHSHGPKKTDVLKLINHLKDYEIYPKILEQNVFSNPTSWESELDFSFQLSKWCQWLYQKRGGDTSKSKIIPYAVITDNFKPSSQGEIKAFRSKFGIPENAFVIGRIGQSITTKWCYTIADVFEKVAETNPNVFLLLISPPTKILNLFEKSKYKKNIVSIDVIFGDKNLSTAYSSMDVFYHAAEQGESFGHVLAESILCGTPVITLSTPWGDNSQLEVVNNGTGGFVVHKPKTAEKIINKMIKDQIIVNPKKGIEHIKNNYDYLNVCKKAIAVTQKKIPNRSIKNNELWEILNNSFDKPNKLDLFLLSNHLRQFIRLTSGYNSLKTVLKKTIKRIERKIFSA